MHCYPYPMSNTIDTLTESEAEQARQLVRMYGAYSVAKQLGLFDERTLYRAIARVGSARLTILVVRERLRAITVAG